MPIPLTCPAGHRWTVSDAAAGHAVSCPACGVSVTVPSAAAAAAGAAGAAHTRRGPAHGLWRPAHTEEEKAAGFLADRSKIHAARTLAGFQIVLALFSASPAAFYWHFSAVPGWAVVLVVAATLQIAYAIWMALVADWSTVWVTMAVWAATAAGYGLFWTVIMFTAAGEPIELLDIDPVRHKAGGWCLAMLILSGVMTGICGRTAARWRRLLSLKG